jgi:hypothetical protein
MGWWSSQDLDCSRGHPPVSAAVSRAAVEDLAARRILGNAICRSSRLPKLLCPNFNCEHLPEGCKQNDGISDSSDIRDRGTGGDAADLAAQQEVGLLSARCRQPNHRHYSIFVLVWTFVGLRHAAL